jgi:hypothetical protein
VSARPDGCALEIGDEPAQCGNKPSRQRADFRGFEAVMVRRSGMPTSRPQIAFLAAALVLLVLPILVMLGLSALGVAMHFGMMSQMERMMNGEASAVFLVLFIAWVLIVLAVVFALVSRLVRATRSRETWVTRGKGGTE